MKTRPTHLPPQTLQQAKKAYNKHGPRISSQEARHRERSLQLHRRAEECKERDAKRRLSLKRRKEREEREREARRRGLPTPARKLRASQTPMTEFVKVKGKPGGCEGLDLGGRCEGALDDEELDDGSLLDIVTSGHVDAVALCGKVDLAPVKRNLYAEFVAQCAAEPASTEDVDVDSVISSSSVDSPTPSTLLPRETAEPGNAWDEFIISNTQIERDISVRPPCAALDDEPIVDNLLFSISTQDLSFSADEKEDLGLLNKGASHSFRKSTSATAADTQSEQFPCGRDGGEHHDRSLMPPPPLPRPGKKVEQTCWNRVAQVEFEPAEFELLSTQDFKDVMV